MKIIVLEKRQEQALATCEDVIKKHGLAVVPTDTVYGIIGDAAQADVVRRLYNLKQRPKEKAFPVFVRDIAMARQFAYISDSKAKFLERVWPGAVTAIFHHKEKLPPLLTAGGDTIALRMPKDSFLSALLNRINVPLAQSSANISGMPPAATAQEAIASFEHQKQKPDLIIDGGTLSRTSSTVLDFTANKPRVIRSGLMSKEEIDFLMDKLIFQE